MRKSTTPTPGRRRINPNNYFEAGEVSILRSYFEMKLRKADPPLQSLFLDESDNYYAVRLWNSVEDRGSITAISNAVARICLADCQDRLPQWAAVDAKGNEVLGRRVRGGSHRPLQLQPERLLCINWADSGPGFSWPEDYLVTLLPGFDRYVVTASADSTDSYGVTDFAIGHFHEDDEFLPTCRQIIERWWRERAADGGGPWEYLFEEGLFDEEMAEEIRDEVWPGRL